MNWCKPWEKGCKPWEEGFKHSTYTWSLNERDEQILFMDTIKLYLSFQSKYTTSDESFTPAPSMQADLDVTMKWIFTYEDEYKLFSGDVIHIDGLQYSFSSSFHLTHSLITRITLGSINSDITDTPVCNSSSVFITFKKIRLKDENMMKICLNNPGSNLQQ